MPDAIELGARLRFSLFENPNRYEDSEAEPS